MSQADLLLFVLLFDCSHYNDILYIIMYCSRPELLKGVYGMGFNRPSKIQEKALPMLMAQPPTNFIAQSQSGTGKTAAFVLAMLSRVDTSKRYPQVRMMRGVCGVTSISETPCYTLHSL